MFTVTFDSAKEGQLLLDNVWFTTIWLFWREVYANAEIVLKTSSERLGCDSWHKAKVILMVLGGITHSDSWRTYYSKNCNLPWTPPPWSRVRTLWQTWSICCAPFVSHLAELGGEAEVSFMPQIWEKNQTSSWFLQTYCLFEEVGIATYNVYLFSCAWVFFVSVGGWGLGTFWFFVWWFWRWFFLVLNVLNPCKRGRNLSPHKIQAWDSTTWGFAGLLVIFRKTNTTHWIGAVKVIQHGKILVLFSFLFPCLLWCISLFFAVYSSSSLFFLRNQMSRRLLALGTWLLCWKTEKPEDRLF